MKRLFATLLVATAALFCSFSAKAIEDPFKSGTVIAGAHFGVLPGIGTTIYGDYVLVDSWWRGHFSVGAEFGYTRRTLRSYDVTLGDIFDLDFNVEEKKTKWNNFAALTRTCYGLNISDSFEVHAGVLLGLGIMSTKELPKPEYGFAWGGLMGLRYFFTENLAGSFEMQYTGYSPWLNIGLAFKF